MALRDSLRPNSLDEIVGQQKAKLAVKDIIHSKKPEHLLLIGPVGTGKTSLALILARLFTGQEKEGIAEFAEPAWFHLNSAQCGNKTFIERIVQEVAQFDVLKIFIFDEAHSITRKSQTLLLNALEKQGGKTFYIFCTTHPLKLCDALRSRCRKALFEQLSSDERATLLKRGCQKLGLSSPPAGLLDEIQRRKLGRPRSILNALDAVALGQSVEDAVKLEMPDAPSDTAEYFFHNAARRYSTLKSKKLCIDCGKRKPRKARTQCWRCAKSQLERVTLRKKKARHAHEMTANLPGQRLFAVA
jgi:replication factor C small subunit